MTEIETLVHDMPKCELHVHLEGTLEADMKFMLAARNGIDLPYADAAALRAAYDFHDLESFLRIYYEGLLVLRSERDFHDLCMAYLRRAHAQHVVYTEMFFDPQAHTARGIGFDAVMRGLLSAQQEAARALGIESRLILCFMRNLSEAEAMATLDAALPYRDAIVGVGLDSYEVGNPPAKFARVFARARAEGFRVTMHCDVNQPGTHEHLRQALDEIRVDRIDHGVNVLDEPALVDRARARGVSFTLCPFANQVVLGAAGQEPVRRMLDEGLRATLNSDDPAYMQGLYVNENILLAQQALALDRAELLRLGRNGFEAAWMTPSERERHLQRYDAWAAAIPGAG